MFIATRSITKIRPPILRRLYSSGQETNAKAGHARVYTNIIPAMVPIFLLGSAVYLVCNHSISPHLIHLVIFHYDRDWNLLISSYLMKSTWRKPQNALKPSNLKLKSCNKCDANSMAHHPAPLHRVHGGGDRTYSYPALVHDLSIDN